jgi:DNA-binding MarR family transcriptional regulator
MESISLTQEERKALIRKMERETKPGRRLRMHIALLAADGHSPTEIARVLYCSRTTVYAITRRFRREGEAALQDRQRRGPRPKLEESDRKRIEALAEGAEPWALGWVRSRWSCLLLAWQLLCERGGRQPGDGARRRTFLDPEQKRQRLLGILRVLQELARGRGSSSQSSPKPWPSPSSNPIYCKVIYLNEAARALDLLSLRGYN